jgi:hypothetical protein
VRGLGTCYSHDSVWNTGLPPLLRAVTEDRGGQLGRGSSSPLESMTVTTSFAATGLASCICLGLPLVAVEGLAVEGLEVAEVSAPRLPCAGEKRGLDVVMLNSSWLFSARPPATNK